MTVIFQKSKIARVRKPGRYRVETLEGVTWLLLSRYRSAYRAKSFARTYVSMWNGTVRVVDTGAQGCGHG